MARYSYAARAAQVQNGSLHWRCDIPNLTKTALLALATAILTAIGPFAAGQTPRSVELGHLSGPAVWALEVALRARRADRGLSASERGLRNFDVSAVDRGETISILFEAHQRPGEEDQVGGRTSLGRDMSYTIRASDGAFLGAQGFK